MAKLILENALETQLDNDANQAGTQSDPDITELSPHRSQIQRAALQEQNRIEQARNEIAQDEELIVDQDRKRREREDQIEREELRMAEAVSRDALQHDLQNVPQSRERKQERLAELNQAIELAVDSVYDSSGVDGYELRLSYSEMLQEKLELEQSLGVAFNSQVFEELSSIVDELVIDSEDLNQGFPLGRMRNFVNFSRSLAHDDSLSNEVRRDALYLSRVFSEDFSKNQKLDLTLAERTELRFQVAEDRLYAARHPQVFKENGQFPSEQITRVRTLAIAAGNDIGEYLRDNPNDLKAQSLMLRILETTKDIESNGYPFKEYAWDIAKELRDAEQNSVGSLSQYIPDAEQEYISRLVRNFTSLEVEPETEAAEYKAQGLLALARMAKDQEKPELALRFTEQALTLSTSESTIADAARNFGSLGQTERALELSSQLQQSEELKRETNQSIAESFVETDITMRQYAARADSLASRSSELRSELFTRCLNSSIREYNVERITEEGVLELGEDVSTKYLIASNFGIKESQVTSIHLQRFAATNPELAELILNQEKLPAGSVVILSATPAGAELERVNLEAQILALEQAMDPETLIGFEGETALSERELATAHEMLAVLESNLEHARTQETLAKELAAFSDVAEEALALATHGQASEASELLREHDLLLSQVESNDPQILELTADLRQQLVLMESQAWAQSAELHLKERDYTQFENEMNQSIEAMQRLVASGELSSQEKLNYSDVLISLSIKKIAGLKENPAHDDYAFESQWEEGIRNERIYDRSRNEHLRLLSEIERTTNNALQVLDGLKEYNSDYALSRSTYLQTYMWGSKAELHDLVGQVELAQKDYEQQLLVSVGLDQAHLSPNLEITLSDQNERLGWFSSIYSGTDVGALSDSQLAQIGSHFESLPQDQQRVFLALASNYADYCGQNGFTTELHVVSQVFERISSDCREKAALTSDPDMQDRYLSMVVESELARANFFMAIHYNDGALDLMRSTEELAQTINNQELRSQLVAATVFNQVGAMAGLAANADTDDKLDHALQLQSFRRELEGELSTESPRLSREQVAFLYVIEANTFLAIREASKSEETFEELRSKQEQFAGIEFIENAILEYDSATEDKVISGLQVALAELNSESLEEALAFGLGGAAGGAAVGAGVGAFFGGVGALPGAAIGALVGGAIGTGYLKGRNLIRGWDRIGEGYSTGRNNISARQSFMDAVCVGADVISIFAPLKGAGAALKGGGDIVSELAEAEARTISKRSAAREFVQGTLDYGGRWATGLTITGLAFPLASTAYDLATNTELTPEQKKQLLDAAVKNTVKGLGVATVYIGANYAINRFAANPLKTVSELRNSIREAAKDDLFGDASITKSSDKFDWLQDAFDNAREPSREVVTRDTDTNGVDTDISWMEDAFNADSYSGGGRDAGTDFRASRDSEPEYVGYDPSNSFTVPDLDQVGRSLERNPGGYDSGGSSGGGEPRAQVIDRVEAPARQQLQQELAKERQQAAEGRLVEPEIEEVRPALELEPELRPIEVEPVLRPKPEVRPLEVAPILKPELEPATKVKTETSPQVAAEPSPAAKPAVEPLAETSPYPQPEPLRAPERSRELTRTDEEEQNRRRRRRRRDADVRPIEFYTDNDPLQPKELESDKYKTEKSQFTTKDRLIRQEVQVEMKAGTRVKKKKNHSADEPSLYSLKHAKKKGVLSQGAQQVDSTEEYVEVEEFAETELVDKYYFVNDEDGV
ncbi:MAG: hypothetical protein H6619_01915 [Deltaproteobacteria bacterium]|nr:hypothetical protein [Deltaproteobacteria bacterium]